MSGIRQALFFAAIPIGVGLVYLVLQVVNGAATEWFAADGEVVSTVDGIVGLVSGTMDPAGVTMLIALGFAMGFGMFVILRGARDL